MLKRHEVKFDPNYPHFGLVSGPVEHKQHPNQQHGLNLYVNVINFETGEKCFKKLYSNSKGLHFKHKGYEPMYLENFIKVANFLPHQVEWIN